MAGQIRSHPHRDRQCSRQNWKLFEAVRILQGVKQQQSQIIRRRRQQHWPNKIFHVPLTGILLLLTLSSLGKVTWASSIRMQLGSDAVDAPIELTVAIH